MNSKNEPEKCPTCGNLYTHKKNCPKDSKELKTSNKAREDPRKQDPEIREILNTEALDQ